MNSLMWTATTRAQHMRDGLRFASDLTDAEWAVLEPLLPAPAGIGRPAEWPMREIVNAIFYVLRGGIAWRMLPPCFPPRQTVYGWFAAWRSAHVWEAITHRLVMLDRERAGREASPSAAVIDSQSVKITRPAARVATTPARRCSAASGTPWSTPTAAHWCCKCIPRPFKTATG